MRKKDLNCRCIAKHTLCALVLLATATACTDNTDGNNDNGHRSLFSFSVETNNNWNVNRMKPAQTPKEERYNIAMEGKIGGKEMWLSASTIDGISSNVLSEKPLKKVEDNDITRATPINDINQFETEYGAFGLLGYSFTSSIGTPNFLYDVETTKQDDQWAPEGDNEWPGNNVKFYAYAPYKGEGITLSDRTQTGAPVITYTTPDEVADQKDLMLAESSVYTSVPSDAIPMQFNHLLSAIKFKIGSTGLREGNIRSITLNGVKYSGSYDAATKTWTLNDDTKSFTQEINFATHGSTSANQAVTTDEQTFLLPPQVLGEDASAVIVFEYNDLNNTPQTATVTASLSGRTWTQGKTITYAIDSERLKYDYVFTVEGPAENYTIAGETQQYKVTSYKVNIETNEQTPVEWQATEYSVDGGTTWTTTAPAWLAAHTAFGGNNITLLETHDATMGEESHETEFSTRNPVADYDLSTHNYKGETTAMNTANCYIVNRPGTYKLPLVYGNAIKNGADNKVAYNPGSDSRFPVLEYDNLVSESFVNHLDNAITNPYIYNNEGCVPAGAQLVWQDHESLITNVALSSDKHYLTFTVDSEHITPGNSIVAVTDASGTIMWSWHIWVTDKGIYKTHRSYYLPNYLSYYSITQQIDFDKEKLMLGYLGQKTVEIEDREVLVRYVQNETGEEGVITYYQEGDESDFPSLEGMPLYYQWGRKDPMLQANDEATGDHEMFNANKPFEIVPQGTMTVTYGTTIQNPNCFFCGDMDWRTAPLGNWYDNAWNGLNTKAIENHRSHCDFEKTINDPCPVGFHIPDPILLFLQGYWNSTYNGVAMYFKYNGKGKGILYTKTGRRLCSYTSTENKGKFVIGNYVDAWTSIPSYYDGKLVSYCGYASPHEFNSSNQWGSIEYHASDFMKCDAFAVIPITDKDFAE